MSVARYRNAAILIAAGLVLLANTLGYLEYRVWWRILSLWPIILICLGLEYLFKNTRVYRLALLSPIIILLTFAGAVIAEVADSDDGWYDEARSTNTLHWEIADSSEFSGMKELKVYVEFGAGELTLESGGGGLAWIEWVYHSRKPRIRFHRSDDVGYLRVRSRDRRSDLLGFDTGHYRSRMVLNPDYPIDLSIDTGASDITLDLSDFVLTDFDLDGGAMAAEIVFGDRAQHFKADIEIGAAAVEVKVPRDVGVKLAMDSALSSTDFRGLRMEKTGDVYYSDNYHEAASTIDLRVDSGVSSFEISTY